MAGPITNADVGEITERRYTKGIEHIGFTKDSVLWSLFPKHSNFYERTLEMRNRYGINRSGSHTFAKSRSNTGASPYGVFQLTRAEDFGTILFENQAVKSLRNNAERLVSLVEEETTSVLQNMGQRLNHMCYRNAGGSIGVIQSGGATQVLTLTQPELLINYHPGKILVTSNTDGTSGVVDANPTEILSVDREAGTITTAAASWNAAGGFSDGDHLFIEGDFGLALYGLDSWVPAVKPTDTFLGQNRALDPVYLGGIRYVAAPGDPDGSIYRTLVNAAALGQLHGARCSDILMHPQDLAKLLLESEAKIDYNQPMLARMGAYGDKKKELDVGITGVVMTLPTGSVRVIGDLNCPRNLLWMLDMRTWSYYGLGGIGPTWIVEDGGKRFLRTSQIDINGIEAQVGWYGNIGCKGPGCNIRVDITNVL